MIYFVAVTLDHCHAERAAFKKLLNANKSFNTSYVICVPTRASYLLKNQNSLV